MHDIDAGLIIFFESIKRAYAVLSDTRELMSINYLNSLLRSEWNSNQIKDEVFFNIDIIIFIPYM